MTELATVDQAAAEVLGPLEADAALARTQYDDAGMEWLPNWFLAHSDALDTAEKRLAEQFAILKGHLKAKRAALWWNWGNEFQAQVSQDLHAQGGKKRSVTYATGNAGWRKTASRDVVVIDDPEKAEACARLFCPDAVTVTLKPSELLKYVAATGDELEGVRVEHVDEKDSFFPKRPELPRLEVNDE